LKIRATDWPPRVVEPHERPVHALKARNVRDGPQTMGEGGGIATVTIVEALWRRR